MMAALSLLAWPGVRPLPGGGLPRSRARHAHSTVECGPPCSPSSRTAPGRGRLGHAARRRERGRDPRALDRGSDPRRSLCRRPPGSSRTRSSARGPATGAASSPATPRPRAWPAPIYERLDQHRSRARGTAPRPRPLAEGLHRIARARSTSSPSRSRPGRSLRSGSQAGRAAREGRPTVRGRLAQERVVQVLLAVRPARVKVSVLRGRRRVLDAGLRGAGRPRCGAVELTTYATVQQATGEDWTGLRLTLSTALPLANATPPR